MFWRKLCLITIFMMAIILFLPYGGHCEFDVPQKDISFNYQINPEPKLGEIFNVAISFVINEKTEYSDNPNAGAIARMSLLFPQEYVSGDTILTGKLQAGITYELSASFRANRPGLCQIGITVITAGEKIPCTPSKLFPCQNGYRGLSTNTCYICAEYFIESPDSDKVNWEYDTINGAIFSIISTSDSGLIPRPMVQGPILPNDSFNRGSKKKPSGQKIKVSSVENKTHSQYERRIYFKRLANGEYIQTSMLGLPNTDIEWRLIFKDNDTYEVIYPRFPAKEGDWGKIEFSGDSAYIFKPAPIKDTIILEGIINDSSNIRISIDISATWQLEGIFRYTDPYGATDNRLEMVTINIYSKNPSGDWVYGFSSYTDNAGYFNVLVSGIDIAVQAISENWDAFAFYTDGHFDPSGDLAFYYDWIVTVHNPQQINQYIPDYYSTISSSYFNIGAAFNICNVIRNGYNTFGYWMPDAVPVYYDDSDGSINTSCYGAYSIYSINGIIIRGRGVMLPI